VFSETNKTVQAKIYHASDHDIDPRMIDPDALYVINRLREANYETYLVGGGVRDLLVHQAPKDFDISTSATPEEIKRLFRRQCLLIGRRFRLAHIRFGPKIIELATFRSGDNADGDLIVRDNQWGSPEEDALRRDFTINGLFYDPQNHSVIDYVGGWADIHKGVLRTIGDPGLRFKQDPVRMIRALKFQARFGFDFDPKMEEALLANVTEIKKSSPSRVLEEIFRMLESGAACDFFDLMTQYHITDMLFPRLAEILLSEYNEKIYSYLDAADTIQKDSSTFKLERPVLMACLLFPILEQEIKRQFTDKGITAHLGDITMLALSLDEAIITSAFAHFPRRISSGINFILTTQYRFTPLTNKRHYKASLFFDKSFPLALYFFKLRSIIDPDLVPLYKHWKAISQQNLRRSPRRHNPDPQQLRNRH
jgi:poly(A) polymerase